MKIKNIDKVAERIIEAVKNKEQIIIYGDSDLDGVASMVIVKETIDNLISLLPQKESFPKVLAFSPDRKNEGYGLNEQALEFIKSKVSKGLIITVDCGITNFKEVDKANKIGFSVVIVDHHQPIGGVPNAEIVVAPKQEGDNYPFKDLCNAGLAFKLSKEILKEKMSSSLRNNFLELAALATIFDMMPEVGENEEIIKEGLEKIESSQRPGLSAMFTLLNPMDFNSKRDMIIKINSALNSVVIENHVPKPYEFFVENDFEKAKEMAKEFFEEHQRKQVSINNLTEEIREKVENGPETSIIFEGSSAWEQEHLGSTSSRLCNYFNRPVFLYKKKGDISRGTVRVPKGMDAVKSMESCGELLEMFGGHPPAAGFTVKNENLDRFKECLKRYFEKK
ncbi:MAG: DHH family phosphoesterase [Candidatus Pacebacteria bacterium]|nr:DHH family phosphoesterase [Candidatus Paceibacterota bacterium]